MKYRFLIISLFFSLIISAQTKFNKEWIAKDVSIFQHFFENFPVKQNTTLADLKLKLIKFKSADQDSIGFGGILYDWTLPGGYITIHSNVVSYKNQIIMTETYILKEDIKYLKKVFKLDRNVENKFHKFFSLKVRLYEFNDTTYNYTYINQAAFEDYKNHVAKYLGKQSEVDITNCKYEF